MIQSKLYNFLLDPKYRIWRHILLISIFTLISIRQIAYIYQDCQHVLGNNIYIIQLITSIIYVLAVYVNIYFLVPRLLLNKKYKLYFVGLFFLALTVVVYFAGQQYVIRSMFGLVNRSGYFNIIVIVSNLPFFVTSLICLISTSATILFKKRIEENQRVNKMEQEHIKSERDRLKEQISPSFLSSILSEASKLTETEPKKASDMLMRLGGLLRYQLYDCNREKVLLSTEVKFIKEYLDLEQIYSNRFKYQFEVDNNIGDLFTSPMLFIPFLQNTISKMRDSQKQNSLYLNLKLTDNNLIFICQSTINDSLSTIELYAIKKRLNLIYTDNYLLSVTEGKIRLQLNNVLAL